MKQRFDKKVDELNNYQFKQWIEANCVWYNNSVEPYYLYKPTRLKYYTCEYLYDDYLNRYKKLNY
jgi:hypothetical protein